MKYLEKVATDSFNNKPNCLFIYVNDTFVIWPKNRTTFKKIEQLNTIYPSIKLTIEIENNIYFFLDVPIYRKTKDM